MTYARLMRMTEEELEPDVVIVDEVHRVCAEMWSFGYKNLIEMYPEMKQLGLSATHIRYLDNRRDITKELFDGNVGRW